MKIIILISIMALLLSCSGKILDNDMQERPCTTISISISQSSHVTVEILDSRMEPVKLLYDGIFETGHHSIVWTGHDDEDRVCPSGVYYARLETESSSEIIAMLMLK